jgi:hypothetical protein
VAETGEADSNVRRAPSDMFLCGAVSAMDKVDQRLADDKCAGVHR